jgi:hypothetical protein
MLRIRADHWANTARILKSYQQPSMASSQKALATRDSLGSLQAQYWKKWVGFRMTLRFEEDWWQVLGTCTESRRRGKPEPDLKMNVLYDESASRWSAVGSQAMGDRTRNWYKCSENLRNM